MKMKHGHEAQSLSHFIGYKNINLGYLEKESDWEMGKNKEGKITDYMRSLSFLSLSNRPA